MIYRRYDYIRMIQFRDNKSMEIRSIREETTFLSLPLRKNKSYLDCYCCYLTVLNVFVARREKRRKRRWIDSLFNVSRVFKWNEIDAHIRSSSSHRVWMCERALVRVSKERKEARSWEYARSHAWRINSKKKKKKKGKKKKKSR